MTLKVTAQMATCIVVAIGGHIPTKRLRNRYLPAYRFNESFLLRNIFFPSIVVANGNLMRGVI